MKCDLLIIQTAGLCSGRPHLPRALPSRIGRMRQTRREFALAALLAVPLLGGAGQQAPARRIEFTAEQTDDLNRISAWLNGLSTLSAQFVQINPRANI